MNERHTEAERHATERLVSDTPLNDRDAALTWRAFRHMPYAGGLVGMWNPDKLRTTGDVLELLEALAQRLLDYGEAAQKRDAELYDLRAFVARVKKMLAPLAIDTKAERVNALLREAMEASYPTNEAMTEGYYSALEKIRDALA